MRPWIKRTLFGALGAVILAGGLAACAQHHGPWSEADSAKMREHVLERVGKELTLDDTQKQKLVVLADRLKEERVALAGPANDPRAEFQALLAGPKFERDKAQALVDAKTAVLRSKSPEVITAAGDFFDSLKPEQQQKVRDFLAKHRHGMHG
ncbi:MAG TPA: Spy/CpxP family protein refolding chaperone [Burkholderiaceae bacterium]|jgi:Spy/CpxP family protein refolding chaperone